MYRPPLGEIGLRTFAVLWCALVAGPAIAADGLAIYKKHCASCHGSKGQGKRSGYKKPLVGDKSVIALTRYIEKTMPEDEAHLVKGKDAAAVSQFIYDAFYSPSAQLRNHPPRVELARLTVTQYRNSVADVLDSFRPARRESKKRGIYTHIRPKNPPKDKTKRKPVDRNDRLVNFNWGDDRPDPQVDTKGYNVVVRGSLIIEESGVYDLIVETPNGVRLYLDNHRKPVINQWVRTGNHKRHKTSVRLLAGRLLPFKIEMFKERREKAGALRFLWKPPHRAEQLIPHRQLTPEGSSQTFIVQAPFPPDDRSLGYERGTSVSKAWDEATTAGALEAADFVIQNLKHYAGSWANEADASKRLPQFSARLAERAFRRPLAPAEKKFFVDRLFAGVGNDPIRLEMAVKQSAVLVLKSPRFLFPEVGVRHDAYTTASRMALGLWDSVPDQQLTQAAREGRLKTRPGIIKELNRMVKDPRTRAKMRRFYHQWLQLDHLYDLSKDAKRFPQFNDQLVSDLRTSLDLFLDEITWSNQSDYRQLLTADGVFLNERLAKVYGGTAKGAGFKRVSLEDQHRAGIVTHPLLMAGFAYDSTTSPIHRGVFVARSLLGRRLRPPEEAVTPEPPTLHPNLTTRQRIAKQTQPMACVSCHEMINPLGFPMEHFDPIGRFRTTENKKPINATGSYELADGKVVKFNNVKDMAAFLAHSPQAHEAFVERLFQEIVKQPVAAYGLDRQKKLTEAFAKSDYNIQKLLVEIVAVSALQSGKPAKGKSS